MSTQRVSPATKGEVWVERAVALARANVLNSQVKNAQFYAFLLQKTMLIATH